MRTESMNHRATDARGPAAPGGDYAALAGFVVACLAVGGLGSLLTASTVNTWYPTLVRPPLTPPGWVFGPVWTLLYVLMGVAAWLVWRTRRATDIRRPMSLFCAQLVLNLVWSGLFFSLSNPGAALVEIVLLWAAILATIGAFRRCSSTAAMLLVPYAAWVTFATYLNAGFWWLNR